jgi:hypothetical protein
MALLLQRGFPRFLLRSAPHFILTHSSSSVSSGNSATRCSNFVNLSNYGRRPSCRMFSDGIRSEGGSGGSDAHEYTSRRLQQLRSCASEMFAPLFPFVASLVSCPTSSSF